MKDRQVEQSPAQLRIPVFSTLFHLVSMPAIVFLRAGFGYAYLRPKALFFAFAWAFGLFTFYAWHEPQVWRTNALLCWFGIGAIVLYCLHLIWAFATELHGSATHDNYSGTPHLLRIAGVEDPQSPSPLRQFWAIWAEPAIVLLAALALQMTGLHGANLSTWLFLIAPSLWLKEALNYWFNVRQRKRQRDTLEDAEDGLTDRQKREQSAPPAATRKDKVRRIRRR